MSLSEFACLFVRSISVSIFAGIVLLAAGCNSYSGPSEYQQLKQQQQNFIDQIAAVGGTASKEGKTMFGFQMSGWLFDLSNAELTDQMIEALVEVGQQDPVFQLNLSNTNITDEQLAKLDAGKVLQKMVDLNLSNTAITDAGLDQLSNVHCLMDLNLKGTAATSAGAKRLGDRKIAHESTPAPFKKQPKVKI
ncbi:MAG: hypothetical protein R3C09_27105 [Pirellulaceae bacterium]